VRAALDVPVVGTVPAIKPAALLSRSRVIGVLGTEATVRQAYVDDLAARFAGDCVVLRHGSAELVRLAEAKLSGEAADPARYRAVLAGLFDQPEGARIDVIVNACTHFPLLAPVMAQVAPDVRFVDGGPGIARRVAYLTQDQAWPATPGPHRLVFTRLGDREAAIARTLANHGYAAPELL